MLLFVLACGLSVTLGLMNFINLAHGSFAMAGGYCTVILVNRLGVPFALGVPIAFLVTALLGGLFERTLYVHVYARSHLDQVLFTIGLVFMSVAAVDYVMGSSQQFVQIPDALQGQFNVFGIGMGKYRLLIIAICGLLTLIAAAHSCQDAFRQPAARGGRRSARGARARHQCRGGVRHHLCVRLGLGRAWRRARRRNPRPRSDVPAAIHDLFFDRRHGRRHIQHHRAVRRLDPARHWRRRRESITCRRSALSSSMPS